ncbi:MAG TPA: ABC transporter ATP-binding protein [Ilumatobacteraceae bacterium]|nr:ABC transporter ATP-binding protein [Ilumatobacteraceae bacterium]
MRADESMTTTTAAIEVRGLGKVFRGRVRAVSALDGVELRVGHGEFVTLLGPSGCGKSTLLRAIGGLLRPDSGSVTIAGVSADQARAAKQFALVPQAPALVPWKTLAQNVRFLATLHRGAHAHPVLADAAIDALLSRVGLAGFEQAYPHELSGGMQQRASLVRAFALGAPVLLMDEPFAALDEITRSEMRYLLADLRADPETAGPETASATATTPATTVVFVTHSLAEAVVLSDRVAVMASRPGRIVAVHDIPLARPRTPDLEDSPQFHALVKALRADLHEHRER